MYYTQIGQYYAHCFATCFSFFFNFWLLWVLVAVHRLSLVAASGSCSVVAVLRLLIVVAFLVA